MIKLFKLTARIIIANLCAAAPIMGLYFGYNSIQEGNYILGAVMGALSFSLLAMAVYENWNNDIDIEITL